MGKVEGKTAKRHASSDFIAFLTELIGKAKWAREIHIVLDNLSAHKTHAVSDFSLSTRRCAPFHPDLLFLAQSGRDLVRQDRTRCDCSWRLHFRRRSQPQINEVYSRIRQGRPARPLDLHRSQTPVLILLTQPSSLRRLAVRIYDGRESMSGKIRTPGEVADIIVRFLSGSGLYPQEFNDFFESSLSDPKLDAYRQRCEMLHSEFEPRRSQMVLLSLEEPQRQAQREAAATEELERMVTELRLLERHAQTSGEGTAS